MLSRVDKGGGEDGQMRWKGKRKRKRKDNHVPSISLLEGNFPMTLPVHFLIGWSVGLS